MNKPKHGISLSITVEDYERVAKLKEKGFKIITIFREGLMKLEDENIVDKV